MPDALLRLAADVAGRAHVPYSRRPAGAALRLADGRTVAAPRLENASFPLTIPALTGAWALAGVAGSPPVAVALTRPFEPAERAFLDEVAAADGLGRWHFPAPDRATREPAAPDGPPAMFSVEAGRTDADGAARAFAASQRAVVPASAFAVGAVLEDADGRAVAGANVEHVADWTRGLCAERVALVAARAAGLGAIRRVFVACAPAPGGTPCGGCRQVLAELAPGADVVLWAGDAPPERTTVEALLPGAFGGAPIHGAR